MTATITVLLIVAAIIAPLFACVADIRRLSNRHGDLMQPGIIMALFWYIYVLLPALYIWLALDYTSNWAGEYKDPGLFHFVLLLHLIGLMGFGIGYKLPLTFPTWKFAPLGTNLDLPNPLWIALLSVGLVMKIAIILRFGGVEQVLIRLSPYLMRLQARTDTSQAVTAAMMFFASFMDAIVILLIIRSKLTRRNNWLMYLGLFASLASSYLISSKRSLLVYLFVYLIGFSHYLRRPLSLPRAVTAGIAVAAILVAALIVRATLPIITYGIADTYTDVIGDNANLFFFYMNSAELALYDMVMFAVEHRNRILQEWGGAFFGFMYFNLAAFTFLIPRALWPGKPEMIIDTSHIMYWLSTGRSEDIGYALGVFGVGYVAGGFTGVLLGMFVLGIFCRFVYLTLAPTQRQPLAIFFYLTFLWILFQFMRFGTIGYTLLLFVQYFLLIFVVVSGALLATPILRSLKHHTKVMKTPAKPLDITGPRYEN